jgi:hypothetical protein
MAKFDRAWTRSHIVAFQIRQKRSGYVCGSYLRFGLNRAFYSLFCAYCGQAVDMGGWIL